MMFFVYETGKILHTPGTAFLFNNPIYTEIELNKTGTYFFHQKKVGFFPPCFLWKSFFLQQTERKQKKKKTTMQPNKDIPGGRGEKL